MNYRSYIEQVLKLPFVNDEKAADSAIKVVLGILASKLHEDEARRLTDVLPPELNLGTLRGHQQRPIPFTADEFIEAVATHMHLNHQHASNLIFRVFHCVKEAREGAEIMDEIRAALPSDWADVVDRA